MFSGDNPNSNVAPCVLILISLSRAKLFRLFSHSLPLQAAALTPESSDFPPALLLPRLPAAEPEHLCGPTSARARQSWRAVPLAWQCPLDSLPERQPEHPIPSQPGSTAAHECKRQLPSGLRG